MAPRADETLELLAAFAPPPDPTAADSVARTVALLGRGVRAFDRARYDPGHITASALVLAPDGDAVLLVHHERLERWLQPGGHIEPGDATVGAAARREVLEETGLRLPDLEASLVAVDVHEIPAARGEPAHHHHDLMFAFFTDDTPTGGSARAEWWPVARVRALPGDPALLRAVDRAVGTTSRKGW